MSNEQIELTNITGKPHFIPYSINQSNTLLNFNKKCNKNSTKPIPGYLKDHIKFRRIKFYCVEFKQRRNY